MEAEVARFERQVVHEVALDRGVLRTDRTHRQPARAAGVDRPRQLRRIRLDRDVWIEARVRALAVEIEHDACIDGDRAARVGDERVDVELAHFRQLARELGQAQQHALDRAQIHRRHASELAEQAPHARALDHVARDRGD